MDPKVVAGTPLPGRLESWFSVHLSASQPLVAAWTEISIVVLLEVPVLRHLVVMQVCDHLVLSSCFGSLGGSLMVSLLLCTRS